MKRPKISMLVPGKSNANKFFSIVLKKELLKMPAYFTTWSKIFVVSGINGDFHTLKKILIRNGIINTKYQWTFEDGRLVILGNCFDEKKLECLWLIYSLEEKAEKLGGHVHFIPGKKELENLNGGWRDKHPRYAMRASKYGKRLCVLYDGNGELYRWLRVKNAAERIGDFLFTHGTLDPYDLAAEFPDRLEEVLRSSGARLIVAGNVSYPGVTCFLNGKLINVNTGRNEGISRGLLIYPESFCIADSNGTMEELGLR